ncbi:sensor histidine kinase [Streptomyces sp. HC44]|uniref:histidine kinase n=1 Tax=Streptomyces scabichelini TaxID=2711217 RepID=A0A6G4UZP6_9ACTN|nr:sensor domain-containing protein [Streptomyces scabichelini]NGO07103.1 sensor histidine kinase [Streptomyces scabichelini]
MSLAAGKAGRNRSVTGNPATLVLRGVGLTGLALAEAVLLVWVGLALCLVAIGVGAFLLPGALNMVRNVTDLQRRLAHEWSGVRVEAHYLPESAKTAEAPAWRRAFWMLTDTATWRDVLWLLVNPAVGSVLALLPAILVVDGLWGLTLPFLWEPVTSTWDGLWFAFIPVNGQSSANLAAALGVVEIAAGLLLAPRPLLKAHGRWVRFMLGRDTRAGLTKRVEHLASSRSDTMGHQASELRRIERDLHDGAQVRLVALGMTLSAAESLVEQNPEAMRALLNEAKDNSAKALDELRNLVNGVHPPLLADRGLVDAVRTLALELPFPVKVTGAVPGWLPAQVESGAYFATAELLGNVAKHAMASQASVDITYADGALRVAVHDNGIGGADPAGGSGLRGVERRLAAFDGLLAITSPSGGPTMAAFEIQCELLSEKAEDNRSSF